MLILTASPHKLLTICILQVYLCVDNNNKKLKAANITIYQKTSILHKNHQKNFLSNHLFSMYLHSFKNTCEL